MPFNKPIYFYVVFILISFVSFGSTLNPAISAVLLECPKFQRRAMLDCERQMMVNIRVSSTFQIETLEKFLLLNEVYDQRKQTKAKLMSPYLIQIRRGEPVIMYPLKFSESIRCATCGHKSGNNTSGLHEQLQPPFVPLKSDGEIASRNVESVVPVSVEDGSSLSGIHLLRSTHQQNEEKQHQRQAQSLQTWKQQHIENEASVEESSSRKPKAELQKKVKIGIMDALSHGRSENPSSLEEDMFVHDMEDTDAVYSMQYDADEYDERIFNDDTRREEDNIESVPIDDSLPSKGFKARPSVDMLSKKEQLFLEVGPQSDAAHSNTIKAFQSGHGHAAVKAVGNAAGVGRYSGEKPHEADIQEDWIRTEGEFDAEIDGIDVDAGVNKKQNLMRPLSLLGMNVRQLDDTGSSKLLKPKHVDMQRTNSKWADVQSPELNGYMFTSSDHSQKDFLGNLNRKDAPSLSPTKTELNNIRLWQSDSQQQHLRQKPYQPNEVEVANKKFLPVDDDFNTKKVNGNSGSNNFGEIVGREDFDREDASAHDSSVIESRSNIAKIDEIRTATGGMGDEFYWNILNYPQGKEKSYSKSGKFDSLDHKTLKLSIPQGVPSLRNANGTETPKNNRKNSNRYNGQRTGYDNFARKNLFYKRQRHDKDQKQVRAASTTKRDESESKTGEKFFDKSLIARMRTWSSDPIKDNYNGASNGVVETSGMYSGTRKDDGISLFPLNDYPGVHSSYEYIPPQAYESQYKILENIPHKFIPQQPEFAKEISDPHLNFDDKYNLLEVLTPRDEIKDEILEKLLKELDSSHIDYELSNQYQMPTPAFKKRKSANLSIRDAYQYDELDDEHYIDMEPDRIELTSYEKEPIHSCDDKKCKSETPNGKSCLCDREARNSKCLDKHDKKIRSVSDVWYSVFNMSAPSQFLTIQVGIYRKQAGAWWKIVPSITLTSLSGIYANGNLSILFSSHVDIIQLKRPFSLENHKLLIPQDNESQLRPTTLQSIDPRDILAINSNKFDLNGIQGYTDSTNYRKDNRNDVKAKKSPCNGAIYAATEDQTKRRRSSNSNAVLSIGDLGYFPDSMNILQQCPTDPKHLCLNMLNEEVPAFTVKIKLPFLQNALISSDNYKVRIESIISDGTAKGALQVAVVLVNEDSVAHEFTIWILDCPMTCGTKTTVKKDLAPHIGEHVSFLLPLEGTKDTKFHCKVEVKSPDQKVISRRNFIVETTARCLCIWDCECYCIQSQMSHNDYNVCHKLKNYEEHAAGFIHNGGGELDPDLKGFRWFWLQMYQYTLGLLFCMLFLGLLKAALGAIGFRRIGRLGYNYVQPLQKYDYASRCRRFFINILFFVVLPFIFCCKCFNPNEEDLLIASTEWQCTLLQQELSDDSYGNDGDGRSKKPFGWYANSKGHDDDDDEETILSQHFQSGKGSEIAGVEVSQSMLDEYLIGTCQYGEEEDKRDIDYVLQALKESRESMKMLSNSHYSNHIDLNNSQIRDAEQMVSKLVASKIVYRTFSQPLRNVDIPIGQKYSMKGYFVPVIEPGYQFFTPSPVTQLRRITSNRSTTVLLPPVTLQSEDFSRTYTDKLEVLKAGDLSVEPPVDAPCINSLNTANESQLTTATTLQAFTAHDRSGSASMSVPISNDANDVAEEIVLGIVDEVDRPTKGFTSKGSE